MLLRRINLIRVLNIRHKSVVIIPVESKISRANKIKQLNYENKQLYGETNKDSIKSLKDNPSSSSASSEIYWTLEKPKQHKQKITVREQNIVEKARTFGVKKKAVKKAEPASEPVEKKLQEDKNEFKTIYQDFTKFKAELPKPVKLTINDALDSLDAKLNKQTKDKINECKKIPFDSNQLKIMTNFPLVLEENSLMTNMFNEAIYAGWNNLHVPSVSKILEATMSDSQRNALMQWKNLKIAELGLEGFEQLQRSYLDRGKMFHECLYNHFCGETIKESELALNIRDNWKSLSPILDEFETPAVSTEQQVSHPYLLYKGIVDCVTFHDESLAVVEWKNSDRPKKTLSNTYDAPIQLCAYIAALNATQFKETPIRSGLVVVTYNNGDPANLFKLSEYELENYFSIFLKRLQEYWTRYRDNTLTDEKI